MTDAMNHHQIYIPGDVSVGKFESLNPFKSSEGLTSMIGWNGFSSISFRIDVPLTEVINHTETVEIHDAQTLGFNTENTSFEQVKEIQILLHNAKYAFFDLQTSWQDAELFEEMMITKARQFGELGERAIQHLFSLIEREKDEIGPDCYKREAAYILATMDSGSQDDLRELLNLWEKYPTLSPSIVQALKYGQNPDISEQCRIALLTANPYYQARLIEILGYRGDVDTDLWNRLYKHSPPHVAEKILREYLENGVVTHKSAFESILVDENAAHYEDALLTSLIAGVPEVPDLCRKKYLGSADSIRFIPLYLAFAGTSYDLGFINRSLREDESKASAIQALGFTGLPEAVPILIQNLQTRINCLEDWKLQKTIVDSLELITNAGLEQSFPIIEEVTGSIESEIAVCLDWQRRWLDWWLKNKSRFREGIRYRRGKKFTLASCIEEMEFPSGNFWTRQGAFIELQIRSGYHTAPFHADWYVNDQINAIKKWKSWWQEQHDSFPDSQWLYAGWEQ